MSRAGAPPNASFEQPYPIGRGRRASRGPRLLRPGDPRYRSLSLLVVLGLLFGVVVLRLGYVQTLGAQQYVAYGEEQRIEPIALPAARGTIFDRNGKDLALSTPVSSIGVDPSVVTDPRSAARRLARVLGLDEKEVAAKLASEGHFEYLARQVDDEVAERVAALDIPGVIVFDESARLLPAGDLARGVLGSVDPDNVGVSGLEQRYDDQLAGDPGEYMVERDLDGRTIPGGRHLIDPAEPGDDIVLTIDRSLQYATEGILAEQVRTVGAKAGWAIVSDPRTGEILALANVETDPKTHEVGNTGNNRAVTEMYEPGSVNKVITMAAALEEGVVTPETVLQVPDTLQVAEHTYGDAHSLPSEMTASDVLAQSSNIGTIKIAQRLGTERVDDYLRRFGFGQETALGLPHEARGLLVDPDNWSGTSIGSIPIGQGISVTAMQMLLTYNTIANDGVYVPPTLLEATFDAEGERHEVAAGEGRRVVSPTTAAQVREMLAEAVASGTGEAAAIDGYETAGKTGTARKPQPGGGYRDEQGNYHHVATFAGFIPADDPQVSIIVVIDEPTTSPYAGDVAAPAFANIGRQALRTLGIAPPAATDAVGPPLEEPKVRAQPAAPPTTATTVPTTTTTVPGATTTTAPGTSPTTTLATTTLATTTTSAPARGG
ncbi:MAG TPA: penicillin-binding protein 2 [Acidimicrobiales bacterium]|nr:penicillin-binding protein 2 [Acidimicrobiales bacterium]